MWKIPDAIIVEKPKEDGLFGVSFDLSDVLNIVYNGMSSTDSYIPLRVPVDEKNVVAIGFLRKTTYEQMVQVRDDGFVEFKQAVHNWLAELTDEQRTSIVAPSKQFEVGNYTVSFIPFVVKEGRKEGQSNDTILKRLQDIDKEMREAFEKDPRAFGSVCQNVVGIIENRVLGDLKSACGEKVRFSLDVWAGRTIQLIAYAMFDSDYGVERRTVTVDLVKVKMRLVNNRYLICGLALDEPQSAKVRQMLDKTPEEFGEYLTSSADWWNNNVSM